MELSGMTEVLGLEPCGEIRRMEMRASEERLVRAGVHRPERLAPDESILPAPLFLSPPHRDADESTRPCQGFSVCRDSCIAIFWSLGPRACGRPAGTISTRRSITSWTCGMSSAPWWSRGGSLETA